MNLKWISIDLQGWIQEFFVGGDNLKKLEKMTSAAVGRAENWWFFLCFYAYLEKIGKKSWKNWKKSWKKFSGGGDASPHPPPWIHPCWWVKVISWKSTIHPPTHPSSTSPTHQPQTLYCMIETELSHSQKLPIGAPKSQNDPEISSTLTQNSWEHRK